MWDAIKAKIATLAEFDKTRQAFGARQHRYQFGPHLSEGQICAWEKQSETGLPESLRSFFVECGDGGAGPFYGMKRMAEIRLYRPDAPFLDSAHLMALAKQNAKADDDDCDYDYEDENSWYVPQEAYQGLVSVMEYGCGDQVCSVTNGERSGTIVLKTLENGLVELGSLQGEYHRWLDEEISRFERIIGLMDECESATELNRICVETSNFYDARSYMVSYLGIAKPAGLFGDTGNRYHGAVQFPWYDEQFPKKKKKFWIF